MHYFRQIKRGTWYTTCLLSRCALKGDKFFFLPLSKPRTLPPRLPYPTSASSFLLFHRNGGTVLANRTREGIQKGFTHNAGIILTIIVRQKDRDLLRNNNDKSWLIRSFGQAKSCRVLCYYLVLSTWKRASKLAFSVWEGFGNI